MFKSLPAGCRPLTIKLHRLALARLIQYENNPAGKVWLDFSRQKLSCFTLPLLTKSVKLQNVQLNLAHTSVQMTQKVQGLWKMLD